MMRIETFFFPKMNQEGTKDKENKKTITKKNEIGKTSACHSSKLSALSPPPSLSFACPIKDQSNILIEKNELKVNNAFF